MRLNFPSSNYKLPPSQNGFLSEPSAGPPGASGGERNLPIRKMLGLGGGGVFHGLVGVLVHVRRYESIMRIGSGRRRSWVKIG